LGGGKKKGDVHSISQKKLEKVHLVIGHPAQQRCSIQRERGWGDPRSAQASTILDERKGGATKPDCSFLGRSKICVDQTMEGKKKAKEIV